MKEMFLCYALMKLFQIISSVGLRGETCVRFPPDEYSQGLLTLGVFTASVYGLGFVNCRSTGVSECSESFHNVPSVFMWFSGMWQYAQCLNLPMLQN